MPEFKIGQRVTTRFAGMSDTEGTITQGPIEAEGFQNPSFVVDFDHRQPAALLAHGWLEPVEQWEPVDMAEYRVAHKEPLAGTHAHEAYRELRCDQGYLLIIEKKVAP